MEMTTVLGERLKHGKFWTDAWSLVEGCTPVSPGCANCWLAAMQARNLPNLSKALINPGSKHFNGLIKCHEERLLDAILALQRPVVVLVDVADGLFIHTQVMGKHDERPARAVLDHVIPEAACDGPDVVHLRAGRIDKGFAAVHAAVPLQVVEDRYLLPMHRKVFELPGTHSEADHRLVAEAVAAHWDLGDVREGHVLNGDQVSIFKFFTVQNSQHIKVQQVASIGDCIE